jgi:hypothetical protein
VLLGAALLGCSDVPDSFRCSTNAQCTSLLTAGQCEPSGYCSVPSDSCATGRVYDSSAGEGLGGSCTGAPDGDLGVSPTDGPSSPSAPDLFGEPPCSGTRALFCEDFESGYGSVWEETRIQTTTILIDDTRPFAGKKGQHYLVPPASRTDAGTLLPGGGSITTIDKQMFPMGADLWLSARFYFNDAPIGEVVLMELQQRASSSNGLNLILRGGKLQLSSKLSGGTSMSTGYSVPAGRWLCLAMHVQASSASVAVDGVELSTGVLSGSFTSQPWDSLRVGYDVLAATFGSSVAPGNEVWIDEVRLTKSMPDCAQ